MASLLIQFLMAVASPSLALTRQCCGRYGTVFSDLLLYDTDNNVSAAQDAADDNFVIISISY